VHNFDDEKELVQVQTDEDKNSPQIPGFIFVFFGIIFKIFPQR
jgi:hypothetical protein